MADTTTHRVLRLLGLLQQRRVWTGPDLAAELGVTDRCVRRDVERLRDLGYQVAASQGVGGGYRLGAGQALPPLLLDDDETVAITVALRLAAGSDDAALRALAKLDQVLPPRLRAEVHAFRDATATLPGAGVGNEVDGEALMSLARACRDGVRVRFDYASRAGQETERDVEPVRLVATGRRWYLLAFDLDRDDWRTYRLDRMSAVRPTTWRVAPRAHPDPVAHVQQSVTAAPYRHVAVVRVHAPVADVRARVPPGAGVVEPDDVDGWSRVTTGGDDLDVIALHLARLDAEVEVVEPDRLRAAARSMAARLARMGGGPPRGTPPMAR